MRLSFDSIEEVKEFVANLKGTRGKKGDDAETTEVKGTAPAPLMPPAGGFAGPGAAAGFPGAAAVGGGAFPGGVAQVDPAVQTVVTRIVTKLDAALASGSSNPEGALTWFRSHFGPEAAQATLDQIKQVMLARLPVATLENIAKMMGT
jgi:hypothetical protein